MEFRLGRLIGSPNFNLTQSNIALEDAPGMTVAIGATERLAIDVVIRVNAATNNPDLQVQLTGPASSAGWLGGPGIAAGGTSLSSITHQSANVGAAMTFGLTTSLIVLHLVGEIEGGGTAGNAKIQVAQANSVAEAVTLYARSRLLAGVIGA